MIAAMGIIIREASTIVTIALSLMAPLLLVVLVFMVGVGLRKRFHRRVGEAVYESMVCDCGSHPSAWSWPSVDNEYGLGYQPLCLVCCRIIYHWEVWTDDLVRVGMQVARVKRQIARGEDAS